MLNWSGRAGELGGRPGPALSTSKGVSPCMAEWDDWPGRAERPGEAERPGRAEWPERATSFTVEGWCLPDGWQLPWPWKFPGPLGVPVNPGVGLTPEREGWAPGRVGIPGMEMLLESGKAGEAGQGRPHFHIPGGIPVYGSRVKWLARGPRGLGGPRGPGGPRPPRGPRDPGGPRPLRGPRPPRGPSHSL